MFLLHTLLTRYVSEGSEEEEMDYGHSDQEEEEVKPKSFEELMR